MFKSMNVQFPVKVTRFATAMPELRDNIGKLVLSVNHIVGSFHYRDDVAKMLGYMAEGMNAKWEEAKAIVEVEEKLGIVPVEEKEPEIKQVKKQRGRPKKNVK